MTTPGPGFKMDHWGRNREIVSLEDHALVRPVAKEVKWHIAEAIRFDGVDRRFLLHEMPNGRAQFTIARERLEAFREAGRARARSVAERHEKRLREDAAYAKRKERETKQSAIYAAHRKESAEAAATYEAETTAADAQYGEIRIRAGEVSTHRKAAAVAAYRAAIDEADEDRDEALAALED